MPVELDLENAVNKYAQFPPMAAVLWVKSVEQKVSSKGACQDTFTCEVIGPETVEFEGEQVSMIGRECKFYITYSENAFGMAKLMLKALGITDLKGSFPTPDEIRSGVQTRVGGLQDRTKALERHQFQATIRPEPYYKRLGKGKDAPYVLDENGAKILTGYGIANLEATDVLSPAEPSNRPY